MIGVEAAVDHGDDNTLPRSRFPGPELPIPIRVEFVPSLDRLDISQTIEIRKVLAERTLRPIVSIRSDVRIIRNEILVGQ